MQNLKEIVRQKLAVELVKLRRQRGLSLQEVALLSPLSQQMIYDMEQGRNRAFELYVRLLKFYGKKIDIVVDELNEK